jgi:hypothetical protein
MQAQLASALTGLLRPLADALDDASALESLAASAGWYLDEVPDDDALAALGDALGIGDDLATLTSSADPLAILEAGGHVLGRLTELASGDPADWLAVVADAAAALPAPLNDPEALLQAIGDIADGLLTRWLEQSLAVVHVALRSAGVLAGSLPERVDWQQLIDLAANPADVLTETYLWGGRLSLPAFDVLMRALGSLANGPVRSGPVDPAIADRYWGAGVVPPPSVQQYTLPIVDVAATEPIVIESGVALVIVPVPEAPQADPHPTGLYVGPTAGAGASVPVSFGSDWTATITAGADLTGTAGLTIRPTATGGVVAIKEAAAPALDLGVAFTSPSWSFVLGDADGAHIELDGLDVGAGIRDRSGQPEPYVSVGLANGLHVVLPPPELDGFLRMLLGDGIDVEVDVDIDVSTSGVRINGGIGLDVTIPVNRTLGPLSIDTLRLRIVAASDDVSLWATVAASFALGPFTADSEGLGLALSARPEAAGTGTFGTLDVALDLLPPTRISARVEGDVVSGDGFIDYNPVSARYTGALSLDILSVGIDALVIVDTQLPGEPDGWAFFASLSATFPGIPLGFGFVLLGAGGLIALNRTMDAEALSAGLRAGAVDALLFPDDPLGDAAALIAQVDEYFPLSDGNTVVGPVVQIGWGSPTLITAQLGVMISLPDGVIAVLGSIEALLPTPDAPVLVLHMDTLGAIDAPGGTFSLLGSLYDSQLLDVIQLGGDLAVYLQAGAQPYFLLSVGGYHPGFRPPSLVPASMHDLRRMQASIDIASNLSVSVQAYFALTSNSVQFGASVNVVASVDVELATYTAKGWLTFDVLLIFSPFKLSASMSAGVAMYSGDQELMGVQLAFLLEGPDPWYAIGTASFRFLGIKINFNLEVGDAAAGEPKPLAHPHQDVVAALRSAGSWYEVAPADTTASAITYLQPSPDDATTWVRPDHQVAVRQSAAPLNRTLEIVGQAVPAPGEQLITLVDAGIGDRTDITWELADDWFAPAQFEDLSASAKLSRESYELMNAGATFGAPDAGVTNRAMLTTSVTTEFETGTYEPEDTSTLTASLTGAAAVGRRFTPPDAATPKFTIAPSTFTVAHTVDGRQATDVLTDNGASAGGISQYAAMAARDAAVAGAPGQASKLAVVPATAVID